MSGQLHVHKSSYPLYIAVQVQGGGGGGGGGLTQQWTDG